jgi:hypothetical protein
MKLRKAMGKRTIIPAELGWSLVDPITDEDDTIREFLLEPVIAWVIVSQSRYHYQSVETFVGHYPVAMTIEGIGNDEDVEQVLKRPDGKFVAPMDRQFDTDAEVVEYLNQRAAYQRQLAQKRAAKRD